MPGDPPLLRLSCPDTAFPLLAHEDVMRLIRAIGVTGIDIRLYTNRTHLRPEHVAADPVAAGRRLARLLQERGLDLVDVFVQFGSRIFEMPVNDPEPQVRKSLRDIFATTVDFTHAAGCTHMTGLPGVPLDGQPLEVGMRLAAEETEWRVSRAAQAGITYAIEPHIGSNCSTVEATLEMLRRVRGLSLTFDPAHLVYQGHDCNANALVRYASHFHARCAAPKRLQVRLPENCVDFRPMVERAVAGGGSPRICVEYTWLDWNGCNQVDNISESILLKRHLEQLAVSVE